MPYCARCGTNIHPFSFRSFSKVTRRCNKCDSEIERAVIRFIDVFREFAGDGVLTRAEWRQLEELAASENLDLGEALQYASPDVTELVRKGIEIATKDNVITEHEEKYFDFLLAILAVPEPVVNEVRTTITEYKTAQEIRKGNLPTVQSSFNFWPGEICYLELPAIYINTDTKTYPRRSGRLWATNTRLLFISPERDFELEWKKVNSIARDGNTLIIEMSIKKGNGLYIVDRPIMAEAVISMLIQISFESQSKHVPPKEKSRNQQTRSNTNAPDSFNQQQDRTPYDVLDLPPNADVESIKLAYRRMAKLYHPDKVATLAPEFQELAERRMKEINSAFQQLMR
jgi:DnaJ like chaperone protein